LSVQKITATVAHRPVAELPLQHAERMPESRTKPRFQRLKLFGEPPKYHWLPFFAWCIAGSRLPLLFLIEVVR